MTSQEHPEFIVRHARLFSADSWQMGNLAHRSYFDSNLSEFLSPDRKKYPETCIRNYSLRSRSRMLSPRMVSLVACPTSSPSTTIGYVQIIRHGDTFPSATQRGASKLFWYVYVATLTIASFVFKAYVKAVNWVSPDLSENKENIAKFEKWIEIDNERYWNPHKERWHVVSCVVAPEWQRKGIGMTFMDAVKELARGDGVVVGLEASSIGVKLYEKAGFQRLGEFYGDVIEDGGGVYIWTVEMEEEVVKENRKMK